MNGVINVYKEKGYTSHDVVAKLRGILKQKKIGHTGTLDPEAEGVLPVCLGNATKLCDLLTDKTKEYTALLKLGVETDTQDMTGTVLNESSDIPDENEIRKIILSFVGKSMQIPPMYSALKVNGKKLYELAREGKVVERQPRPIEIFSIDIVDMKLPLVRIHVHCSKGTYIRTLCHDIGQKAGCGAAMEELLRTKVDRFSIENALTLDEIEKIRDEGNVESILTKVDEIFADYPALIVREMFTKVIDNGNPIYERMADLKTFSPNKQLNVQNIEEKNESIKDFEHGKINDNLIENNHNDKNKYDLSEAMIKDGDRFRVYSFDGRFYGLYEYKALNHQYKPYKMFLDKK